jgi:hypothetical protein
MIYTIYKISIAGEDYIGSTKDLKQRKKGHKGKCNDLFYTCKLYTHIRANGGWDCCEITPIEVFECETKRQAECREEHWRREYKSLLNEKRAFRTEEELKEQMKLVNEKHLQINNPLRKLQSHHNCECGGIYQLYSKSQHFRTKRHTEFIQSVANSE